MSKFKQLVLEAFEELEEAPANKAKLLNQFYIKASDSAMQKFNNQDFYFGKFQADSNGKEKPLFYTSDDKKYAQVFNSPDEAMGVLNKIYDQTPIYRSLFKNIDIVDKQNEEKVAVNSDNQQNQSDDQQDNKSNKFKNWLNKQADNIKNKVNNTAQNASNKFQNSKIYKKAANTVDNFMGDMKNVGKMTKDTLDAATNKFSQYFNK